MIKEIDIELFRSVLSYCESSGCFTWLKTVSPNATKGSAAGSLRHDGYVRIGLKNKQYMAHRIAWAMYYGTQPPQYIDHIDGNPKNNAIKNLRASDAASNMENKRKAQANNRIGMLGVKRNCNKWQAVIGVNKKYICLGSYETPEEAHAAYVEAKRKYHKGCTI